MFSRTEVRHRRPGSIEIVDKHVDVHLLGPLLGRPCRRRVVGNPMEDDALAVLGADRGPVGGDDVDLPIQNRTVEAGERTRIGTIDSEEGQAGDGHAGQDIDGCGPSGPGRAAAEVEIGTRSRPAAAHGARMLVGQLHPDLGWTGSALLLRYPGKQDRWSRDGQGPTLLPTGLAGAEVYAMPDEPDQLTAG
jgi:hypothetical protein